MAAATITVPQTEMPLSASYRGKVGMWCLIVAESAIFSIFVVAYLYYAGKSISGPTPAQVLDIPWFNSICLFSSSLTIVLAEKALHHGNIKRFGLFWFLTIALGVIFLIGTGREWYGLIYHDGLTVSSSLFGTTFYSLVGLHAFHVTVGLIGLTIILIFTLLGALRQEHAARVSVFAMYWHFVDVIWVVVLSVVYFIAR
ncbi:MAG TPA: heme-copper oxidase subunit III [Verrucomicrobiae bacterium]|nr:heme-copper oxidase subunit III [Verrucomicrobiae bacterium]